MPENPAVVKSIVTGDLSSKIAKKYGVEMIETLTGFKNVCGKANEYEKLEKNLGYLATKKVLVILMEHL